MLQVSTFLDRPNNSHNLFIISELEIVLHDHIFVLLDLILVELSLLDLGEVPCNDILPCRCDNSVLFLPLALIEAKIAGGVSQSYI